VLTRRTPLPLSLPHASLAPLTQAFALERAKYTPDAIQAFYRFIWTLFYSEYVLLPFL
jgi:hypothetical protein